MVVMKVYNGVFCSYFAILVVGLLSKLYDIWILKFADKFDYGRINAKRVKITHFISESI